MFRSIIYVLFITVFATSLAINDSYAGKKSLKKAIGIGVAIGAGAIIINKLKKKKNKKTKNKRAKQKKQRTKKQVLPVSATSSSGSTWSSFSEDGATHARICLNDKAKPCFQIMCSQEGRLQFVLASNKSGTVFSSTKFSTLIDGKNIGELDMALGVNGYGYAINYYAF